MIITHNSIYGLCSIKQDVKGITSIFFVKKTLVKKDLPVFDFTKKHKLNMQGTDFQKQVWKALLRIKKGQTKTYAEVAHMIGKPTAVRAVASAIAKNNIAVLVPCHRVIKSDGSTGEYRWGGSLKKKILKSETSTKPSKIMYTTKYHENSK